jgi:hypothetical protein
MSDDRPPSLLPAPIPAPVAAAAAAAATVTVTRSRFFGGGRAEKV